MQLIKSAFDQRFKRWGLTLSEEIVDQHQSGTIQQGGWTINFHFVMTEGQGYLEYFASHRMTNDTLNRIYADGRYELVDACQEFHLVNDKTNEHAYIEQNRNFYANVKSLGLL